MMRIAVAFLVSAFLYACAAGPAPQYRSDELFGRVRAGMPQQEVRGLLGAPQNAMDFPRSATTSWGWYGFDTWGYYVEYSVTFDAEGRVVSKTVRRVSDDKGR